MREAQKPEGIREIEVEERHEAYSLLGLGVLVFASTLFFSWQHLQSVRQAYFIEQLKSERAALEELNHQLRLEEAISLASGTRANPTPRLSWPIHNPRTSALSNP
jgi:hypothetical protein